MLDANVKNQLQTYLGKMVNPIEIRATFDNSDASRDMQQLLNEIAELSDRIVIHDESETSSERAPSFGIGRVNEIPRIRFAGIPLGHEFTSLVLALLQSGGHPPKIDDEIIEQIRALDGDYEFETFISLSCQVCPDVIQALNVMAVINPRIRHTMIDGALFQDEVKAREIMSVPSIFMNGEPFAQGRVSIEEIIAKLDTNSAACRRKIERQSSLRCIGCRWWPCRFSRCSVCRA
jgi:alkyl hydroperoxide reductase subunit F